MGSERECWGEMAGCTVYKRVKEGRETEREGKCRGHVSQTSEAGRSRAEERVRYRVQQTRE